MIASLFDNLRVQQVEILSEPSEPLEPQGNPPGSEFRQGHSMSEPVGTEAVAGSDNPDNAEGMSEPARASEPVEHQEVRNPVPTVPTVPTGIEQDATAPDEIAWAEREDVRFVVQDLFRERWHPDRISRELGLTRAEVRAILRSRS